MIRRLMANGLNKYGMVLVLLLLCGYYAWATYQLQPGSGATGGRDAAAQLLASGTKPARAAVIASDTPDDRRFAAAAADKLRGAGIASVVDVPGGDPRSARQALLALAQQGAAPDALAVSADCNQWLGDVLPSLPAVANARVAIPHPYHWPTFLLANNLLNVVDQIVIIAVVAVGMTMVIVTGGIDLSVGSLIALSAVTVAILVQKAGGAAGATPLRLVGCGLAAIAFTGLVGAFSGAMVTLFRVPPFIATLAVMQVASGQAYQLTGGQSVSDFPAAFTWLGKGVGPAGIPVDVLLMAGVFAVAHVVMTRTRFGRYVYAVGGNAEAARLSGVGVGRVLMVVYTVSGLAAGLGGVILASQLSSGAPQAGQGYELLVITAVVVGGTSLSGGEGSVLGTLVGALIIAVIFNGMNLTGVDPYRQKKVLGFVILGAVLLDQAKRRSWRLPPWLRPRPAVADGPAPLDRPAPSPTVA